MIASILAGLLPTSASAALSTDIHAALFGTTSYVANDQDATPCTVGAAAGAQAGSIALPTDATPEQKIAQTFILGFDVSVSKTTISEIVNKYHPGGIYIVGTHDAAAAGFDKAFFDSLNSGIPTRLTTASDEEGGQILNFKYASAFPSAQTMGGMTDAQVEALGKTAGSAITSNGITENLAPVLDIQNTAPGTNDVITGYQRAFSTDPNVVAAKATAFAKGVTSGGAGVTFKHFPGLGYATGSLDNNTDKAKAVSPDIATLRARDLIPYSKLIAAYPTASVMLSNENVKGLDEAQPASVSSAVVNLLRNDYKFTSSIVTDDLNVPSVTGQVGSLSAAVVKALNAGVDRPLFGELGTDTASDTATLDGVISAVKNGGVPPAVIDKAVAQTLATKNGVKAAVTDPTVSGNPAVAGSDTLQGFKLPATTGQTGAEEPVNDQGRVPSTNAPVSFPQYAQLGQAYRDYYLNMRWTFASWDWGGHSQMIDQKQYDWMNTKPRLVLVSNKKSGKSLIMDIMETGPGPSVGTTWRAQHGNTSDTPPPYWQGFQTGTPAGYDGMVAGMPPTAIQALGMTRSADIDPSYGKGGVTTPLTFAWAPDQNATPGPTTLVATGGNTPGTNPSCCNTVTPPSPAGPTPGGTPPADASSTNSAKIYDFFRSKGASAAGAAGIVGNYTDESASNQMIAPVGPDPKAVSPSNFYGIEQWGGSRWQGPDSLNAFATDKGVSWDDLSLQLNFSAFELGIDKWVDKAGTPHTPPSWVLPGWAAVKDQTDPKAAAMAFELAAEGCTPADKCGFDIRQNQAQAAFDQFKTRPVAGGGVQGTPTLQPSCTPSAGPISGGNTTGLSATVLSYAWPEYHPVVYDTDKPEYKAAWAAAGPDAYSGAVGQVTGDPGVDCNGFVSRAIVASGYDPTYNSYDLSSKGAGATDTTYAWLQAHWADLGAAGTINVATLKPGDVAITRGSGHTFLYTGPIFPDKTSPTPTILASSSLGERSPMADNQQNPAESRFEWFRKK